MNPFQFLLERIEDDDDAAAGPRVLAECAAKREMLNLLSVDMVDPHNAVRRSWAMDVLALMAAVYADHPEYDAGWRP